jgi:3-phenylpropionate/cinnamic acid dioxygenase small subunit
MGGDTDNLLRELLDERQIRSLIYRYCRAIDRRQYDDLRACYHPDATDHHGDFYGSVEDFVAHCTKALDSFDRTLHFVGNLEIEVNHDTARSEAYVLALARLKASAGQRERDNTVALRYIDDLERRDGAWRILRRVCVYEWTRTDAVPDGWSLPSTFLRGRRDARDVIFLNKLEAPAEIPVPAPRRI